MVKYIKSILNIGLLTANQSSNRKRFYCVLINRVHI